MPDGYKLTVLPPTAPERVFDHLWVEGVDPDVDDYFNQKHPRCCQNCPHCIAQFGGCPLDQQEE